MGVRVIGVGWPRTGTTSLKAALELLGVEPVEHMSSLVRRLDRLPLYEALARGQPGAAEALLDGYQAILDSPGCCFWRELTDAFPDALVVLTTRDPASWYRSYTEAIHRPTFVADRSGDSPPLRRLIALLEREWLDRVLGGAAEDAEAATRAFVQHEQDVLQALGPRVLRFDPAVGWGPLCEALRLPEPDASFPYKNARAYIRAHGVHEV